MVITQVSDRTVLKYIHTNPNHHYHHYHYYRHQQQHHCHHHHHHHLGAKIAQLVSARPSVREVSISIPGDINYILVLTSLLSV